MDLANGLKKDQKTDTTKPNAAIQPLNEAQWLVRFIFLESIAGVPGMVAGMLRHLHSLRRLKRDNGWIETLLEESYNERMHLLTFMKMCEPGWFMKMMILAAQGVYFNAMFLSYLVSPKICHRFVGYLEEEAVHTYTRCLNEMGPDSTPKWSDPSFQIPDMAVAYWNMPEGHRTMRDLILYIRVSLPIFFCISFPFESQSLRLTVPLPGRRGEPPRRQPHAQQPQPERGSKPFCLRVQVREAGAECHVEARWF